MTAAQLAFAVFGLVPLLTTGAAAADVTLTVAGTRPAGRVFGRVFADSASYKAQENAVAQFALDPQGGSFVRTSLALPPGRYAIKLFQDVKGTGKLETNMFGVPKVPYGFSNDAKGTLGPPSFDAAAFEVGTAPTTVTIKLR